MTRNEQLHSKGYYIGHVDEIITDYNEFNQVIESIIRGSEDKSENYGYRHYIIDENYKDYARTIPIDHISARKKLITENKLSVMQQWYEVINPNKEFQTAIFYFRSIVNKFITELYPNFINFRYQDSITLFENEDFISPHRDGQNPGRLCAILIYLSDPLNYIDGGGILNLHLDNKVEQVIPVRGNYVILDFIEHNIIHSVEAVKNNFKRFCYLTFVYHN